MTLHDLFNITRIISAFLLTLFSVFLLNQKKGRLSQYRFLAAFLLARVVILIGMISWSYQIWRNIPFLAYIHYPPLFLYTPMLYLYTLSVTSPKFQWQRKHYLHFLPFISVLIFLGIRFFTRSPITQLFIITKHRLFYPLSFELINYLLWTQLLIYAIVCVTLLVQYQNHIKTYYSTIHQMNLSWLRFLLVAFLIWKGIFLSGYLFKLFPSGHFYDVFCILVEVGFLYYASMIVYKGLQLPQLFFAIDQTSKYKTSPLREDDKLRYLEKIEIYMQTHKPYLDPNLTLKDLSKKVGIPLHYISQILNDTRKQKFYDYINYYRIQETRKILLNPTNQQKTILEVLYEAGFNSKSVFNSAFKKYIGVTPRQFKEHSHLKNTHYIQQPFVKLS